MDSITGPKVTTMEGKGVGVHSFARSTLGLKGVCWSFGMGTRKIDKQVNYSHKPSFGHNLFLSTQMGHASSF
jgi:hypothetical protein